ncbi:hypothetical protein [Paraflavitalea sp. CAU 1676]|uniref:hypothetical protein n=1 Tax=Paraflavitalea sp. CAU 1676 TaxID=3032598 RepID=UPI0023DA1616|nr:hypothetical protein [Paraflavitalea sp. CAU 1676]MDF2192912.1 hypothetical protein [Paraflavitalea sp. CAU 1676]
MLVLVIGIVITFIVPYYIADAVRTRAWRAGNKWYEWWWALSFAIGFILFGLLLLVLVYWSLENMGR